MIWVQPLNDPRIDWAEVKRLEQLGWTCEKESAPDCTIWRWREPPRPEPLNVESAQP